MNALIAQYQKALEEAVAASQDEVRAKDRTRKAHHALLLVRDELRAKERELLEDTLILN